MASISPFTWPGLRSRKPIWTIKKNNAVLGVQRLTLLGKKTKKKKKKKKNKKKPQKSKKPQSSVSFFICSYSFYTSSGFSRIKNTFWKFSLTSRISEVWTIQSQCIQPQTKLKCIWAVKFKCNFKVLIFVDFDFGSTDLRFFSTKKFACLNLYSLHTKAEFA